MFRRTALAVATGAVALAGVAVLVPSSAGASQTASAVADNVAQRTDRPRLLTQEQRQQLRRTGHLTVTKQTKKHGLVTVLVQRGEVMALTPTSITLQSRDGFSHSYTITDKTKVRERGVAVTLADVKVGERAMVIALKTPQGDVARRIGCLRA